MAEETKQEETETVETGEQTEVQGEETKQTEKTYTKDQVNAMIADRLAREQKLAEEKQAEAKKLAKMDAEQKQKYKLDQANKRAQDAQAQLARYEMQGQARTMFAEAKISAPDDVLNLVVTDKAETTQANVNALTEFAKTIRQSAVDEIMKGKTPKDFTQTKVTTADYNKMSYQEIAKLQKENPEGFKQMLGGK